MTPEEKFKRLVAAGKHNQIVEYLTVNRKFFKLLINMYIAGPLRDTQRLAPVVTAVAIRDVEFLKPHWRRLLKALHDPKASTALKRNTIRMFQWVPIPEHHQGTVLGICLSHLQDKSEAIAVKVFSMSVCEVLARGSDELRRELSIIIEDQVDYAGPALRSRARKVLKKLQVRAAGQ